MKAKCFRFILLSVAHIMLTSFYREDIWILAEIVDRFNVFSNIRGSCIKEVFVPNCIALDHFIFQEDICAGDRWNNRPVCLLFCIKYFSYIKSFNGIFYCFRLPQVAHIMKRVLFRRRSLYQINLSSSASISVQTETTAIQK